MAHGGDILRGHTETIILRILSEGDSYGYEISKSIIDSGEGVIDVKDATIYTAFKRMEEDGLLSDIGLHPAEIVCVKPPHVPPGYPDLTSLRVPEAHQKLQKRRLAGTAGSVDPHNLPFWNPDSIIF